MIFCIYIHQTYWPFLVISLSGFGIRVMLDWKKESERVAFSNFLEESEKGATNSSLTVWLNSSVKPSGPELFSLKNFITDSVSLLLIGLFAAAAVKSLQSCPTL